MNGKDREQILLDVVDAEIQLRGWPRMDRNILYTNAEGRVIGEIDGYSVRGKYVFLFEGKEQGGHDRKRAAVKQLERAAEHAFEGYRVFKFFGHPERLGAKLYWIK